MDLKMPNVNGIQATQQILSTQPRAQIIVLTTYDTDEWVFDAIRAGAVGYLLKDATTDTLAEAIRSAMRGESQIDPVVARPARVSTPDGRIRRDGRRVAC
jgi:DNA-binding NarL/FixJ family response regulator